MHALHVYLLCSQVIEQEKRNAPAVNAKAYFRRGCSHIELGNLTEVIAPCFLMADLLAVGSREQEAGLSESRK